MSGHNKKLDGIGRISRAEVEQKKAEKAAKEATKKDKKS
jgi:hypothetical protein